MAEPGHLTPAASRAVEPDGQAPFLVESWIAERRDVGNDYSGRARVTLAVVAKEAPRGGQIRYALQRRRDVFRLRREALIHAEQYITDDLPVIGNPISWRGARRPG